MDQLLQKVSGYQLPDGYATAAPQEISILKGISFDRNIVQFYGAVFCAAQPMLVLEYMEVCGARIPPQSDSIIQVKAPCSTVERLV